MNAQDSTHQHPPETEGRTIPWASIYDPLVWLLSLGKAGALRQATLERAHIRPGEAVLDVGCGTGDLTIAAKALAGPQGQVTGLDASPEMIAQARRKAARLGVQVDFQVDVVEHMPFEDGSFDVVMSSLMMHHLPPGLKRRGLAEMYRVLAPGGRLLIVDMESSSGGSFGQRMAEWMIHVHGGHTAMQDNVLKLGPYVEAAGFTDLDTGRINRQLSFMTARKAAQS